MKATDPTYPPFGATEWMVCVFMRCVLLADYNLSGKEIFEMAYGHPAEESHPDYVAEKLELFQKRGLLGMATQLDAVNMRRLVTQIYMRYSDDAVRYLAVEWTSRGLIVPHTVMT